MTNSTANNHRAEAIAEFSRMADRIRRQLAIKFVDPYGYIITHDGNAMDVRITEDRVWASQCIPTQAGRYSKENAIILASNFTEHEDAHGDWRAEHWRDVAARYADYLDETVAKLEARNA